MYIWKCHKEKTWVFFFLMEGRKVKQVLYRGRYQWEVGSYKERMKDDKYAGCILYSCIKIETVKIVL
jgi:hypothetical protein